jgi:hypothetical protein
MSAYLLTALGILLMVGCGSVLGRHLGFSGLETFFVVGFPIGIILLSQVPAVALAKRLAALEESLSRKGSNDA